MNNTIHLGYGAGLGMAATGLSLIRELVFPAGRSWSEKVREGGRLGRAGVIYGPSLVGTAFQCVRQVLPLRLDVRAVFTRLLPRFLETVLALSGPLKALSGKQLDLVMMIDGQPFSYTLWDGRRVTLCPEPVEAPMVRVFITSRDLEKFLVPENLRLLLAFKDNDSAYKMELLHRMSGRVVFNVRHEDETCSEIILELNHTALPHVVFTLGIDDVRAIAAKAVRPVFRVLEGRLLIDGDAEFAAVFQCLLQ